MSEEVQIDQAVYDRLIAEGKSERIARAKAKAASVRKAKIAEAQTLGPKSRPRRPAKALEAFREKPAAAVAARHQDRGAAEAAGNPVVA
jgi:menaquinol-cytochrome c reductase cytochrome b/c subunit